MIIDHRHNLDQVWELTWKLLHQATKDREHPMHFPAFCTHGSINPTSRIMVFRVVDANNHFWFYTDSRSDKVVDLQTAPIASILFYHPAEQLQIRVICRVAIHQDDEATQTLWNSMPPTMRKDYSRKWSPGTPAPDPKTAMALGPETFFCALECTPVDMEILQLHPAGHLRARFTHTDTGHWHPTWLTP